LSEALANLLGESPAQVDATMHTPPSESSRERKWGPLRAR
jgi:hypothetical protein